MEALALGLPLMQSTREREENRQRYARLSLLAAVTFFSRRASSRVRLFAQCVPRYPFPAAASAATAHLLAPAYAMPSPNLRGVKRLRLAEQQ